MIQMTTYENNKKDMKKFLFVMDPPETLNRETETSLLIMQELISRGHGVYWVQIEDLSLVHDQPMGLTGEVANTEPLQIGRARWVNLNTFDAVLVRKDPPFDTDYLQMTLILDQLEPGVVQFNDVQALRNFNEKLLPLRWPEFTPATLISMNAEQIEKFTFEHEQVVLKPLNDCSGRGISKLKWDNTSEFRRQLAEILLDDSDGPRLLVAQKFLAEVSEGDKRVYLVDGEPIGQVNRIPQPENFLANIHQGASCEPAELSPRERHIVRTIAPFLREHGIFLAGADFIGGFLTELNITSPSAVRQINEVSGEQIQVRIVDSMLARLNRSSCCEHWCCKAA
jgi:glutathione synthase